jgi:hypothetical protein
LFTGVLIVLYRCFRYRNRSDSVCVDITILRYEMKLKIECSDSFSVRAKTNVSEHIADTTMPRPVEDDRSSRHHRSKSSSKKSKRKVRRHRKSDKRSEESVTDPEWSTWNAKKAESSKVEQGDAAAIAERVQHRMHGGDGGGDDPHRDDSDASYSGSDSDVSGNSDSQCSATDSDVSDEESADESVAENEEPRLMRQDSTSRRREFDQLIEGAIKDENDLEMLESRIKIARAHQHAKELFLLPNDDVFHDMMLRLSATMKDKLKNELWFLATRGNSMKIKRELLAVC